MKTLAHADGPAQTAIFGEVGRRMAELIRPCAAADLDVLVDIWLQATLASHDFIPAAFWHAQVHDMRHVYLWYSQVWVCEREGALTGFYALVDEQLAAIFVAPPWQGQGVGKALMAHAKSQRSHLLLQVYQRNRKSLAFYLAQGFVVQGERMDEATGQAEYDMRWDSRG